MLSTLKMAYNMRFKTVLKTDKRLDIDHSNGNVSVKCCCCPEGKMDYHADTIPTFRIIVFRCDKCMVSEEFLIRNRPVFGFIGRYREEVEYYKAQNGKPITLIGSYCGYRP